MPDIISVRFRSEGKQYYFDPQGETCRVGDGVIVETAAGKEYAVCVRGNFTLPEEELTAPLRPCSAWPPQRTGPWWSETGKKRSMRSRSARKKFWTTSWR